MDNELNKTNDKQVTEKQNPVTEVAIVNHVDNFSKLNLFNENDLVAAENLISRLMKTEKGGGIKSVNDGIAMIMRAQALNLPFAASLEHIHVIQGKTGIDIHIVKALLLRGGCTWEHTKDYEPVYEFTDGFNIYVDNLLPKYCIKCKNKKEAEKIIESGKNEDNFVVYPISWYKDFTGNIYKEYQLNSKFAIAINKEHAVAIQKEGKIPVYKIPNQPVDYIDEWKFNRRIDNKEITAVGKFTYQEAVTAGMLDKDTYKKYPRILIGHRAFTYGARDIASDLILGCMETTELKQVANVEIAENEFVEVETVN